MLKTKKIKRIIVIIFIIYLVISFVINGIESYNEFELGKMYSYSAEELREEFIKDFEEEYKDMSEEEKQNGNIENFNSMTDEELDVMIQKSIPKLWVVMIIWTLMLTLIKNIIPIIVFIVIIITNKRLRREKLNKDDFFKSKNYYRDILEQKRNV